jgi:site-specific recombinase XerD
MTLTLCDPPGDRRWNDSGVVDTTRALPGGIWPLERVAHLREHLIWMRLQGRAECTLAARRRACVRLAEWLRRDPWDAVYEELEAWQIHLMRASLDQVRNQTALVRPYFWWLHARGIRTDNPAALLALPKARRGLPRPIAEAVLVRVITEAPPRLLPWLLLAGWCGLRAAEIANLRCDDFTLDEREQVWVRVIGKGDVERAVAVPGWAWPTIEASLAATAPTWRRPPGVSPTGPAWRRERRRSSVAHVTPQHVSQYCNEFLGTIIDDRRARIDTLHAFRHRVATLTYEETGDIRLVQDLLGHRSLAATQVYTRVAPRRQAAAIAALPHPTLPSPAAARHLRAVGEAGAPIPGGSA